MTVMHGVLWHVKQPFPGDDTVPVHIGALVRVDGVPWCPGAGRWRALVGRWIPAPMPWCDLTSSQMGCGVRFKALQVGRGCLRGL